MSSKKKQPKDIHGMGPIVRGNMPFIALKSIGELGDKGKVVMSLGYSGRIVGDPDRPLSSLAASVINEILMVTHWNSEQSALDDLALLKDYLNTLQLK